ncbi:MAG TPA: hypothetical protein VH332_12270, partial [Nitrospira sp.]
MGPRMLAERRIPAFISVIVLSIGLTISPGSAAPSGLAERVIEHKLANGLTILMVERHQAPIVSLNMT